MLLCAIMRWSPTQYERLSEWGDRLRLMISSLNDKRILAIHLSMSSSSSSSSIMHRHRHHHHHHHASSSSSSSPNQRLSDTRTLAIHLSMRRRSCVIFHDNRRCNIGEVSQISTIAYYARHLSNLKFDKCLAFVNPFAWRQSAAG